MYVLVVILYVLCSLFLVMVVLLQQGKGSGMGAAFGGASNTLFGAHGQMTPLQKITTVSAFLFMALSVVLTFFSTGASSDLGDEGDVPVGQEEGLMPADPGGAGMGPAEAPMPDARPADAPAPADVPAPAAAPAPAPADAPAP